MRLYSGMSGQFISDNVHNSIAEKLKEAYIAYFRAQPSSSEVTSWRNSLRSISQVFQFGKLLDHGIILEYQLPLTSKRLDCMIMGRDSNRNDQAVIIELKQWEKCEAADGENEVISWVAGAERELLHPSAQVRQYHRFLRDNHTTFYEPENPVHLSACSYLHNYNYVADDVLLQFKFSELLSGFPLFCSSQVDSLTEYLQGRLNAGGGEAVLNRVESGAYRPSRKLMEHVATVIKGKSEYVLLDEQLIVYDKVMSLVGKGFRSKNKMVIIVKGGPGTGKSVIALNLMADLSRQHINTQYATGSKAFTETLRRIIGDQGSEQFRYFNSYAAASPEVVDVLICDEAHRIRKNSHNRFTAAEKRSSLAQIGELFHASKVSLYFVDDRQVVRPEEIGSSAYIKNNALQAGCRVYEYTQFRCAGSEVFVNWVNNTLGIEKTPNIIWEGAEGFEFKIFDSPEALETAIREKVGEDKTARLTAGFCWPWSKPNPDGSLVPDVTIGDYKRPWNARPESTRLAKDIPKAPLWAYDKNGINQIGCIYTAQGFEFDYVGVIFGKDLRYDMDRQEWTPDKKASFDSVVKRSKEKFTDLTKNTYRVLLSRGMKGCYVHFLDKETESFFKTRIEAKPVKIQDPRPTRKLSILAFDDKVAQENAYVRYLPVYSLRAAAGYFGEGQSVEPEGWIEWETNSRLNRDLFVARVIGRSMEPRIHDGDYCVFRLNPKGSRQGRIVLAQYRGPSDPDTGGAFTVKEYRSSKTQNSDDAWSHQKITLHPLNPSFSDMEITSESAEDFRIIGEFVDVIR